MDEHLRIIIGGHGIPSGSGVFAQYFENHRFWGNYLIY
jgi:hypothetical protein